ncbi:hypothetical protein J7I98_08015 [Streptomyces sp. ISL-98]|uniref:hypothetical protein n=1 Tax=Streptomyces sp. ISL-98 TaxID=2819192 RepID=UPI001BE8705D|nr:hypothetical protein [Streptomyces sp. ISL-98]MBT2505848.1 hypothetical protein [Streptomyces sp. ISL-98]
MLEVGKPQLDGFTLADKLISRGELEDQLVELWQAFGHVGVDTAAFEAGLAEVVEAIEGWSSVSVGPVETSSGHLRRVLGPGADG